jgi:hypothetical protein
VPASNDAGKPSVAEVLAALRELKKSAPRERHPLTPEELAELEAQCARIEKALGVPVAKLLGIRDIPELHLPKLEVVEVEPEQADIGPLEVVVVQPETKGESGRPKITITKETLLALFASGLERARSMKKRREPSYDSIADEHGLKRTWTTPIVKWAETHQREAREAIASSKAPRSFSTLIRD